MQRQVTLQVRVFQAAAAAALALIPLLIKEED